MEYVCIFQVSGRPSRVKTPPSLQWLAFSKMTDFEPLKFPCFRQELLQQNWWLPADELGRIKIVLSEGFPRNSVTTPFERIKNIVAFSFQHAPLGKTPLLTLPETSSRLTRWRQKF